MEMHQIRYTLAVAHALSFTKAAETCHASQPALSKAVKALEEELGEEGSGEGHESRGENGDTREETIVMTSNEVSV